MDVMADDIVQQFFTKALEGLPYPYGQPPGDADAETYVTFHEAGCTGYTASNEPQRARNLVPLLVPLFVSAFRRANDLALAMEARGYHGGEGRTKMKPLICRRRDYIAYLLIAAYAVLMFLLWKYVRVQLPIPAGV